MPYKVFKRGNKWEVFKLDAENKPTGAALGEHDTEEQAAAQARAIYASEKKPAKSVDDTEEKEMVSEEIMVNPPMGYGGGPCSFSEMDEMDAAGEMAEYAYEMTDKFKMLASNIIDNPDIQDKGDALSMLAKEYAARLTDLPQAKKKPTFLERAKSFLGIDSDNDDKATWTTQFVNNLPDSSFLYIETGGDKDSEGKTVPRSKRHFPYKDAAGKVDLPHLRNAIARIPQSNAPGLSQDKKNALQERARKMLQEGNKEVFIWKSGDTYKWLAAYSNNRRDDDNPPEIISAESHKDFDRALDQKEWPMPELWLWHIDYPVGSVDYHAFDENTGFPVAAGSFYPGYEWAAEGVIKAGWDGVSHGMPTKEIRRDDPTDKTIITRHRTKEITLLPLWAAANKLAFSVIKEVTMDEQKGLPAHKRDEFVKAFGEDRVEQIEEALAGKAKEADEMGLEKKEEAPPATEQTKENPLTREEVAEAIKPLVEMVKALQIELSEMKEAKEKPVEIAPAALVEMLGLGSVIGRQETQVDGRTKEAKDGPEEAPATGKGVTGISFIDGLIQQNQNAYNQ